MATVSIDIRDDIRKANDKVERAFEQGDEDEQWKLGYLA